MITIITKVVLDIEPYKLCYELYLLSCFIISGMGTVNGAYSRNSGYDQFDGNLAMTKIQPSSEPEYSNVS